MKINENSKVTLTLGQLKRLVVESKKKNEVSPEEAVDKVADYIKDFLDRRECFRPNRVTSYPEDGRISIIITKPRNLKQAHKYFVKLAGLAEALLFKHTPVDAVWMEDGKPFSRMNQKHDRELSVFDIKRY